jgi:peptidyl-prolyl cis-trans isomerase SurA
MITHLLSLSLTNVFCRRLAIYVLTQCIVSLLCWHTVSMAATDSPRDFIVAVVDAIPITNHEVMLRTEKLRKDSQAAGKPVRNELNKEALEQLITERALLEQAKRFGVEVDNVAIDQAELKLAAQQQLSLETLHRKLRSEGSSVERLRRELRDQLIMQRFADRNVPGRIQISDSEIEAEIKARIEASNDQNPQIELAHILVAVPEKAGPESIATARQQAQEILNRLQAGADFAAMAESLSDSPDRQNGGLMGVRPLDRYPTLFAQAVRNLKVGQLAPLLRSDAGFHILKLVEKRSSNVALVTETHVRHILLRPSAQLSLNAARARLSELRRQIESGKANFATLARDNSQDGSSTQGGDLGWIPPGVFVPEFEEVMNKLDPGQLSDPTVSRFGVHLIEVLGRRQAAVGERELREMVRASLRDKKYPAAFDNWAAEIRGQSYVEYRDPPQ